MVNDANSLFELPCGILLATASEKGLKRLIFLSPEEQAKWKRLLVFSRPTLLQKGILSSVEKWLSQFIKKKELPNIKLDLQGTDFQKDVWLALHSTIVGETISYGDLAKKAGHEGASRAVGSAMSANPVTVIVPCHRVLKSGGDLGNYSGFGGTITKQWLLKHEAIK
ncbi:methylated-DNA--[protein]-cysteine S-methyltransferase [Deltaproteobacteria bacterium]|nr:methylated-DNA--[protein]-cysteine S-methyltransferase [Deltaproteobacteria bacterium]